MLTAETRKTSLSATAARVKERPRETLDADHRWLLVERILESRSLGKSELLARFLRYVCDRQIRGREAEITEQQIGVKVFGRPEGYNSNEDNIVRNYARTLRKRLEDYFKREGLEEPVVVLIPRGGYVPIFAPRDGPGLAAPARDAEPEEHEGAEEDRSPGPPAAGEAPFAPPERPSPGRRGLITGMILLCFVACLAGYLLGQNEWNPFRSYDARASRLLWSELFTEKRDTFIVPADGGLVMMQSFTRDKVTLPEYVNGSYRATEQIDRGVSTLLRTARPEDQTTLVHKVAVLAARRYTSVADLSLATKLAQLKAVIPERLVVRFARDLRMDDLHTGNAILLGSTDANPWVSLFEPQLNFQFSRGIEYGGSGRIRNTHPLAGEQAEYASITGDPANATYGLIAYVPNLENTGHILLIEGVNMAGTEAAGEFLLRPEQMQPILDRAVDAHGRLQPFEILLKTTSIAANASGAEVLSERVHPVASP